MRVAFCLEQLLAPVPGGTGRYSGELAAALARTAPPGGSVTGWVAWHRDTTPASLAGVAGPRALPLPRRALVAAWERGTGPTPRDADLVHAPTALIPPRRGRPLVVTIHDTVPWTHPDTLTARGAAWHRRMAEIAARDADRIVVPTNAVAGELAGLLPGAEPKLVVAGAGTSTALDEPGDAAERAARLDLPERYLLSLATLEPRKGLDTLLAALTEPAAPDLPLLLVGQSGWGGVDPVGTAARLGLPADRVRLLGRIPDADLAVVLRRATVLVTPSRAEGFGLPVLEAMTAKTPVITSDAPALVEVGGNATVVVPRDSPTELAEAIRCVTDDESLRARLVAAGAQRALLYSWDRTARILWETYAELTRAAA